MTERSPAAEPVEADSSKVPKEAGVDGGEEAEEEGKAPVHDNITSCQKAPASALVEAKAELAKVAQTLREDATEATTGPSSSSPLPTPSSTPSTTTTTLAGKIPATVTDPSHSPPPPMPPRGETASASAAATATTSAALAPPPAVCGHPSTPAALDAAAAAAAVAAAGAATASPLSNPTATSSAPAPARGISADKRRRTVAAIEEMRKRSARYRETPKGDADTDELVTQLEGLEIDGKMAIYDKLFESHPVAIGKAISKKERDETEQTGNSTLVYGEIIFGTLALALHKVKTKYGLPGVGSSGPEGVLQGAGGTFYDIGSGTGKPVIAAAILHPFQRAVGIEILEGLHSTSVELQKTWEEGGLRERVGHEQPTKIEFILGDALDMKVCDWSDATVVFANSTCFDEQLMRRMASVATALKKGTIFITLTKRLPAAYFKVLEHEMFPMSWGSATVYISQKTTDPFGDPNDIAKP